jgi:hypothetical protein
MRSNPSIKDNRELARGAICGKADGCDDSAILELKRIDARGLAFIPRLLLAACSARPLRALYACIAHLLSVIRCIRASLHD